MKGRKGGAVQAAKWRNHSRYAGTLHIGSGGGSRKAGSASAGGRVLAISAGNNLIYKGANLILIGGPGGSKTHLASAIGLASVENGWHVLLSHSKSPPPSGSIRQHRSSKAKPNVADRLSHRHLNRRNFIDMRNMKIPGA